MWTVIGGLVLLVLGFIIGTANAHYNQTNWLRRLPEDLRDVVSHALKEHPLP